MAKEEVNWNIGDTRGQLGTVKAKTQEEAIKVFLDKRKDRPNQFYYNLTATQDFGDPWYY